MVVLVFLICLILTLCHHWEKITSLEKKGYSAVMQPPVSIKRELAIFICNKIVTQRGLFLEFLIKFTSSRATSGLYRTSSRISLPGLKVHVGFTRQQHCNHHGISGLYKVYCMTENDILTHPLLLLFMGIPPTLGAVKCGSA